MAEPIPSTTFERKDGRGFQRMLEVVAKPIVQAFGSDDDLVVDFN